MKTVNEQVADRGDFSGNPPSSIRALDTHTFTCRTVIPIARRGSDSDSRDGIDVPCFFSI